MMRVFLLYPDRDLEPEGSLPPGAEDLVQDLGLDLLFRAMGQGDRFLTEVARQVVLTGTAEVDLIRYRQEILQDVLRFPEVAEALYRIPLAYLERKRRLWLWVPSRHPHPSYVLSSARSLLEASLDLLRHLRRLAEENETRFTSRGFRRFFRMLKEELSEEYLALVERHLRLLHFPRGVPLRAQLGPGNEPTGYTLLRPGDDRGGWLRSLLASRRSPAYTYTLHPRDEAGARILGELRDRGLAEVAGAVAQAAEHVESFFLALRREMAFYLAALNLYRELNRLGVPVAFPDPAPSGTLRLHGQGLCDPTLALAMGKPPVANDVEADGKALVIITGPNRGGKTTFLRSLGLAQLMGRSGLFVAAHSLSFSVATGLFTHFVREEDAKLESGKFEEELRRMSWIVDHLQPGAWVLLNETFAATHEREGSEVAFQVVRALLAKGIRVFYVTFLYEFIRRFLGPGAGEVLFLKAERLPDGQRTFRVLREAPSPTTHAADLYRRVFGEEGV